MQRIGIVGIGLIGGSLALALKRSRPALRILGVDIDARALEQALQQRAIDERAAPDSAHFDQCDAVVLAQPAPALLASVLPIAARMRPGAVLTDVCGSKESVCARGGEQQRVVFVGAHPMAGTEFRCSAARPSRCARPPGDRRANGRARRLPCAICGSRRERAASWTSSPPSTTAP